VVAPIVGLFLRLTLLYVHLWRRHRPLDVKSPLDVEDREDVPFPSLGQGSTVFSLSALFGAYLNGARYHNLTTLWLRPSVVRVGACLRARPPDIVFLSLANE